MPTCITHSQSLVTSPLPKMLEYFLLTGRWLSQAKFMAVLTDRPDKEVEHGPGPPCVLRRLRTMPSGKPTCGSWAPSRPASS